MFIYFDFLKCSHLLVSVYIHRRLFVEVSTHIGLLKCSHTLVCLKCSLCCFVEMFTYLVVSVVVVTSNNRNK